MYFVTEQEDIFTNRHINSGKKIRKVKYHYYIILRVPVINIIYCCEYRQMFLGLLQQRGTGKFSSS
jgi:hypothetical protein